LAVIWLQIPKAPSALKNIPVMSGPGPQFNPRSPTSGTDEGPVRRISPFGKTQVMFAVRSQLKPYFTALPGPPRET